MFKEYTQYDALALAALVNAGEVSAKELLDAAVNQANELNPKLNAIIHRFDERAYAAAEKACQQASLTASLICSKTCRFILPMSQLPWAVAASISYQKATAKSLSV